MGNNASNSSDDEPPDDWSYGRSRNGITTFSVYPGPYGPCSCPQKKLKILYNEISHEVSLRQDWDNPGGLLYGNSRTLFIYADLLVKAIDVLVSNEEGIQCELVGYYSEDKVPHKIQFDNHMDLALHLVLGSCNDEIDKAAGFLSIRAFSEDLKKVRSKAKTMMLNELAAVFPDFPDVVLDKILGYVIAVKYSELNEDEENSFDEDDEENKEDENRKVRRFFKEFDDFYSKLHHVEGNMYVILKAFQFSHCFGTDKDMKKLKKESTRLPIVYDMFLDCVKDFSRMWWSVRTLMEEN